MRLIDGQKIADELLGEIFERGQASRLWEQQLEIGALTYKDIEFADGYDNALEDIYRRLNNAPTVKAIPIEWIKNYISKIGDDGMIYLSPTGCIKDMMKEWEKANERETN